MYVRPPSPKKNEQPEKKSNKIIAQMEERINMNCSVCSHTFNTTNRIPKIVCRRQHTYCGECVSLLQRVRPCRCPECRFKIYQQNIFVNRTLFAVCEYFPILKNEIDEQYQENNRLKKINEEMSKKLQAVEKSHNFIPEVFSQNKQRPGKSSTEEKRPIKMAKPQEKEEKGGQDLRRSKMSRIIKEPNNPQQSSSINKNKFRTFKKPIDRLKGEFIQGFNPIVLNIRGMG